MKTAAFLVAWLALAVLCGLLIWLVFVAVGWPRGETAAFVAGILGTTAADVVVVLVRGERRMKGPRVRTSLL